MTREQDIQRKELSIIRESYPCMLVEITDLEDVATEYAERYAAAKKEEKSWIGDDSKLKDRARTGILGELAVYRMLGFDPSLVDTTIGDSKQYNVPDLQSLGVMVGIKSSKFGNCPLVIRKAKYPEILCTVGKNNVMIHGLATEKAIARYCDDSLVKTKAAPSYKSGFAAYDKLIRFKDGQTFLTFLKIMYKAN